MWIGVSLCVNDGGIRTGKVFYAYGKVFFLLLLFQSKHKERFRIHERVFI